MLKRKKFEDLTIADDFMFCKVMENEKLCKTFLEIILAEEIGEIKEVSTQKAIITNSESKAIRLDVLVIDSRNKIYNIEMQVVNQYNIAKRMRYYQSAIDVANLDKGVSYKNLSDTYIIFVCMFDYFEENYPIYQFENICLKKKPIYLQDGVKKLIINITAFENTKNQDLKTLLEYMKTGVSKNAFTRSLSDMVELLKTKITTRAEYNFVPGYIMDAKDEGMQEQRELDLKEISEAKAETEEAKAEIEKLKAEIEKLKKTLEHD